MKKIKIQYNRPEPSSDQIKSMRDFNAVLSGAAGVKPWYTKSVWKISGGLSMLTLAVAIWYGAFRHESSNPTSNQVIEIPTKKNTSEEQTMSVTKSENNESLVSDGSTIRSEGDLLHSEGDDVQVKQRSRKNRLAPSFEVISINADKTSSITTKGKSVLRFNPGIFCRKSDKKVVHGQVQIYTREFHNALDIALSGITMAYDSAGAHHLQSAGMIEVWAMQGSDSLDLVSGKGYQVELSSHTDDPSFNLYYLNNGSKWEYLGKDKISYKAKAEAEAEAEAKADNAKAVAMAKAEAMAKAKAMAKAEAMAKARTEIQFNLPIENNRASNLAPNTDNSGNTSIREKNNKLVGQQIQDDELPPVVPVKKSSKRYRFKVDVDPKEFPEMAEFNGMYFDVLDSDTNFTDAFYKISWNEVAIVSQSETSFYTFQFSKKIKLLEKFPEIEYDKELYNSDEVYKRMINNRRGNSIITTFNASPSYDGTDSAKVWKWYNEKFKQYETKLEKRKKDEQEALKLAEEREAREYEQLKRQNAQYASSNLVYRSFTAMKMGVYNCDQIYRMTKRTTRPMFFKSSQAKLSGGQINLVDKTANSVIGYYDNSITYNPDHDNMIVVVLPDGRIGMVKSEEMKKWMLNPKEVYAETVVPEGQFSNSADLRRALEF